MRWFNLSLLFGVALVAGFGWSRAGFQGAVGLGLIAAFIAGFARVAMFPPPPNTVHAPKGNPIAPHSRK